MAEGIHRWDAILDKEFDVKVYIDGMHLDYVNWRGYRPIGGILGSKCNIIGQMEIGADNDG